jgi:hypothetical protein
MSNNVSSICSYNKGMLPEADWEEIRTAFIEDIMNNPECWKIEKSPSSRYNKLWKLYIQQYFFKHESGERVHCERGLKLTIKEWISILKVLFNTGIEFELQTRRWFFLSAPRVARIISDDYAILLWKEKKFDYRKGVELEIEEYCYRHRTREQDLMYFESGL